MTRIRSVYPPRALGAIDAIAAYNDLLVAALHRAGYGDAAPARLTVRSLADSDVVLIQYNPFSYGRWGVAPSLVTRLALLRRRAPRCHVCLVVHEPYVAASGLKGGAMTAWQWAQLHALMRLSHSVVAPSSDAARRCGRRPRQAVVIPVGSNLPDRRVDRGRARASIGADTDTSVLVVFGASNAGRSGAHVAAAVRALAECAHDVILLVLGSEYDAPADLPRTVRVIRPGPMPSEDVAYHMAAGDVFLAPYVDGVTTRRGALMAALQHGLPVVGTTVGRSDSLLTSSLGLELVTLSDVGGFAAAVKRVSQDASARHARGHAARRLYVEHFDWDIVAASMLSLVVGPS